MSRISIILFVIYFVLISFDEGTTVTEEFKSAVENENHFIALFTKPCCDCKECLEIEGILRLLSQELSLKLAKVIDEPELQTLYGVDKFPTVLSIRNRKSILYTGKAEKDEVVNWLSETSESHVKELDDGNFEHLTQAATGATTGDWITFFCSSANCKAIESKVEAVGNKLKRKMNTALIDLSKSPKLKQRFNIASNLEILFFRHGKYYRYDLKSLKLDVNSIVKFCQKSFRNYKAILVPTPKSPFDELVEDVTDRIKIIVEERPNILFYTSMGVIGLLVLIISFACKKNPEVEKKKKK